MKRIINKTVGVFLLLLTPGLFAVPAAHAVDLIEVYRMAESSDPQFRQVAANKRAVLEQRPQAIAGFLPEIRFTAAASGTSQENEVAAGGIIVGGAGGTTNVTRSGFETVNYNLNLTQPLFRSDRYFRLQQANSSIKQADAELAAAELDLAIRVSSTYFNVLAAIDNLSFAEAEKRSLGRQLEQAKQRFEVGLTAVTDVQEAQAGYDRAVADEIRAINDIDNAREALREITGAYLTGLAGLTDSMPLVSPEPADIDEWANTAIRENLDVIAALHAVDNAREEIRAQFTGHLPTIDLTVGRTFNKSGGRFGDSETTNETLGIEFNVPIFSGGIVNSRVRESTERLDQQLELLEQIRRQAHRETRESFLGVMSGISQIQALQQAVVSSEVALEATRAGFEVGTRTSVDVVAAERATFQARRDLSRARYDYIINSLNLKQAAGILTKDDLQQVNSWLD